MTVIFTDKYIDILGRTYTVWTRHSFRSGWLNAYIVFPDDHWILNEDGVSDEILFKCRDISGDELVFIKSNTAGYFLKKSLEDCVNILIETIKALI